MTADAAARGRRRDAEARSAASGPSGLADVMRLWPSFINPEARNWCLRAPSRRRADVGIDEGRLGRRRLRSRRCTSAPVPPDSVRGDFAMRDAAVDLLPGVPHADRPRRRPASSPGAFSRSHGETRRDGLRAGGRRMQASDIFFRIPDTQPGADRRRRGGRPCRRAPPTRSPICCRATRSSNIAAFTVDPADVKGQFQGQLTLDLGIGKTVAAGGPEVHAPRARCRTSSSTNISRDRTLRAGRARRRRRSQFAQDHRAGR